MSNTSKAPMGENFIYGLVIQGHGWGRAEYYLRNDRPLYDWIKEPVPEEKFVNGMAEVELPEGYYFHRGYIFNPAQKTPVAFLNNPDAPKKTTVSINQNRLVLDEKAALALMEYWQVAPQEFEAANVPEDRIFVF